MHQLCETALPRDGLPSDLTALLTANKDSRETANPTLLCGWWGGKGGKKTERSRQSSGPGRRGASTDAAQPHPRRLPSIPGAPAPGERAVPPKPPARRSSDLPALPGRTPRRPRAGSRPCTHTGRSGGLGSQRSTGCRPRPPLSAAAPGAGPAPPPPASCGPARPRPERHRPRAAERQLPGTPQPPPALRSLRVSAESR